MTSGSSIKNFSWALKSKKRHRSGSGGSKDHEAKKMSFLSRRYSTGSRRLNSMPTPPPSIFSSSLEVIAPITSDVEFKYTWPINGFLKQVKNRQPDDTAKPGPGVGDTNTSGGLDSTPFDINVNGVQTKWNLSIRFWTGEDGERLANPFVLCLNMLSCSVGEPIDVGIKFRFGVLNRFSGEYEMGSSDTKPDLRLETTSELRSVGYKNIAISDKHISGAGDIQLVCKMKVVKDDSDSHCLSSDLKKLMNDEKTCDLVLEAGGKVFNVHKHILRARSAVFENLLQEADEEEEEELKEKKEEEEDKEKHETEEEKVNKEEESERKDEEEVIKEEEEEEVKETEESSDDDEDKVRKEVKKKELAETNMMMSKIQKLEIKDIKAETMSELLNYVYTDSALNVDHMSPSLLAAAESYKIPGLKRHCEKHLEEILSPNNVASMLLLADKHHCQQLKRSALTYCKDNHTYIMKDDHWKTIEEEKPQLFEEAIEEVVKKQECTGCHTECIKKRGKRFEIEKNSSILDNTKEF